MAVSGQRTAADTRALDDSDYFLSRSFVDRFANEVHGRGGKGPGVRHNDEDSDSEALELSSPVQLRSTMARSTPYDNCAAAQLRQ